MSESAEAREWHRIIRASVRECLETWALQTAGRIGHRGGPGDDPGPRNGPDPWPRRGPTARAKLVVALLPSLIRSMLAAFVEVVAERRGVKASGHLAVSG